MKLLPQGVMEDQLIDLDEATFIWGPSPKDGMHPCAQVQELKLRCILQHNLWEFKDICHPGGEGVKPTKAEFWPKRWYILQSRPFQKATWQEQHVTSDDLKAKRAGRASTAWTMSSLGILDALCIFFPFFLLLSFPRLFPSSLALLNFEYKMKLCA